MEDALGMESYIEQAEDSTLRTKLAVYYARVGLAENERLPWAKELVGPIRDYVIQSLEIDSGRRRLGGGFFSK